MKIAQNATDNQYEKEQIAWNVLKLVRSLNDTNLGDLKLRAQNELKKCTDEVLKKKLEVFIKNADDLGENMKKIREKADEASKKGILSFLSGAAETRAIADMKDEPAVAVKPAASVKVDAKPLNPEVRANVGFGSGEITTEKALGPVPVGGLNSQDPKMGEASVKPRRKVKPQNKNNHVDSPKGAADTVKPETRVSSDTQMREALDTMAKADKAANKPKDALDFSKEQERVDLSKEQERVDLVLKEVKGSAGTRLIGNAPNKFRVQPLSINDIKNLDVSYKDVVLTNTTNYSLVKQPDGEFYLWDTPEGDFRKIYRLSSDEKIISVASINKGDNKLSDAK